MELLVAVNYDIRGRIVRLNMVGEYTPSDIQDTLATALSDDDFPPHALILFDVSKSTSLAERSADDLRHMARHLAEISHRFDTRFALVAGTRLHYGMMRMAEVFSESSGMSARAFLTAEDALKWLAPNDGA